MRALGLPPFLHIFSRPSFQRMLPTLAACSASCAHLYCLLAALAGHQLVQVIVCEPKGRQRRGEGWVGQSCAVGMGLGLACLWQLRSAVDTCLLSLSWSRFFYSHSFGPGFWKEAWETLVRSLVAGQAAEERECPLFDPSAGVRREGPVLRATCFPICECKRFILCTSEGSGIKLCIKSQEDMFFKIGVGSSPGLP